ncbi:unnamed protein product, partial [Iphiclides podalirius]
MPRSQPNGRRRRRHRGTCLVRYPRGIYFRSHLTPRQVALAIEKRRRGVATMTLSGRQNHGLRVGWRWRCVGKISGRSGGKRRA